MPHLDDEIYARLAPGGGVRSLISVFQELGQALPGRQLGDFRIGVPIDEVAFQASVLQSFEAYRADGILGPAHCIQVLLEAPGTAWDPAEYTRNLQRIERCSHPNLSRLFDGGVTPEGFRYIICERVDGTPITSYCHHAKPSFRQLIKAIDLLLEIVGYAHNSDLVHGHLHPDSVLVDRSGHIRVRGTGLAQLFSDPTGRAAFTPLSPFYSSPEHLLGHPIGRQSDIYQLGALIAAVFWGPQAFSVERLSTAIERAAMTQPAIDVGAPIPNCPLPVSTLLRSVVKKCTTPDDAERFSDTQQISVALGESLGLFSQA